jgi:hypothetical protein
MKKAMMFEKSIPTVVSMVMRVSSDPPPRVSISRSKAIEPNPIGLR